MNQTISNANPTRRDILNHKILLHNDTTLQAIHTRRKSIGFAHMTDSFIATSLLHLDNMFTNSVLIVITAFIVVCSVVKLCHRSGFRYLDYIPEPITVLLIGVIFGGVANYFDVELHYFDDETFFVIFLPPIIFEAILNVHKEYFIRHLSVILLFGFIGTLSNIFLFGTSLWLINQLSPSALGDLNPHPVAFYLFATLVSSVDSVIIIGILGEMQVHPSLYFIFIGESILNDGVTLIVFDYIYSFGCTVQSKMNLNLWALIALCGFVMTVKVLGSCFLGAICGSATAFLTKYTYKYTMIEPLIVLSSGYLTYLFDYGISWPGVSSLLVFGIIQTVYTFENVSRKSRITIKRLVHMTAAIAESLILLTIGYTLAVHEQVWNIRFIALSMALCIIWRFLVVFVLASVANWMHWTTKPITQTMKFVIGFCGLRGAISHSLAEIVHPACLQGVGVNPRMYQTTAVFITFFTIVAVGAFLRPLMRLFQIRFEKQPTSLFSTLNEEVIHKAMNAVEEIVGLSDTGVLKSRLKRLDQRYVRPILLRDSTPQDRILETFGKITIALHYASLPRNEQKTEMNSVKMLEFQKGQYYSTATPSTTAADQKSGSYNLIEDQGHSLIGLSTLLQKGSLWEADSVRTRLNTLLSEPMISYASQRKRLRRRCAHRIRHCMGRGWTACSCCYCCCYDVYGDKDQSIPNIQNQLEREKLTREMQTVNSTNIDAFDTETFVGPNVQQSSTERIAESSSTKTTISGYSPEKSLGCFECMQLILSSTISSKTLDKQLEVSRLLIHSRYHTQDNVSYLDHMRHTIHLKQSALRIQRDMNEGSIYNRPNSIRSFEHMDRSACSEDRHARVSNALSVPPLRMPECFIRTASEVSRREEPEDERNGLTD